MISKKDVGKSCQADGFENTLKTGPCHMRHLVFYPVYCNIKGIGSELGDVSAVLVAVWRRPRIVVDSGVYNEEDNYKPRGNKIADDYLEQR